MLIDWRPFIQTVSQHERFLLTTHVRPDGDALGSEKALAVALRGLNKKATIVNASPLPSRYDFLDPEREIIAFAPPGEPFRDVEVIIIVDTGTWNQLDAMADFVRRHAAKKLVIDHHMTQDDLGAVRFVDTTAEAAGRLVFDAIQALGVSLTPAIVNPLFVAVATDTGWFRHGNVRPETFALGSDLMRAGARPDFLYQQIFERVTPPRLRLMGRVLSRLAIAGNGRIAISSILQADYPAAGATIADGEDLVNFTVGLAGAPIGVLLTEMPAGSGIKVSFRSRGEFDVGTVAEQFGGGGHRQASGATIQGSLEEVQKRVLQALGA